MIARLRQVRMGDEADGGYALVLALMITAIVTTVVLGALVVIQPGISGAKRSQDDAAAFVAARSGIEDAMAYLNAIPSCRSASQVCAAATQLGDDVTKEVSTKNLADAGKPRPALVRNGAAGPYAKGGQTFSWRMLQQLTPERYLRVVSTGTYDNVSRTLIADLSLRASILRYGYYTDYESFSPTFLRDYYKPRNVYLSNATTYANVSSTYRGSTTVPRYANWNSPTTASNCGQHWYYESATSPGRASNGSTYAESGRLGTTTSTTTGTAVSRSGGCDLTFSSSMQQDGETYTRDAILSSGAGPQFKKPVWTLWGYKNGQDDLTNPAFSTAGKYYRGDTMTATSNTPQVAKENLTVPAAVGKDGIPENACVFFGPTRVKLNGDGTATVTSPLTRTKNAASDPGCYPASVASGLVGWTYNYKNSGAGAIVTRNIGSAPSGGWLTNPTRSTQTPSAGNELFYFNAPGSTDVVQHSDKSASAYSGCTSTTKYSAAVDATCAWSTVGVTAESPNTVGWTTYSKTTCGTATATNRQLFECEYPNLASTASPDVAQGAGQYKTFRDAVQTELAKSNCLAGTAATQASCVNAIVQAKVNAANSATTVNGSRRYVATTVAGTSVSSTVATGTTGTGPDGTTNDSFFTQPSPAKETLARTPLTTTVKRQVYNSSSSTWGSDSTAFTLTTTQSDYSYSASRGMTYFPNEADVTPYNTGADTAGTTVRGTGLAPQSGDRQPGDLYVDGANKGKLSVLADNDVIVTGNITNPNGYTPATDAVSITAGQDVRNYHPVRCTDQDPTDINNTTPGYCPNDITGLTTSSLSSSAGYADAAPAEQYANMQPAAERNIYAAVFALSGSFGTDNYNRADAVGDLNIWGGLYQSHRGGNGVVSGTTDLSGTTLQYHYVDLQRAELPYVPPTRNGKDNHPWQIVSLSNGELPVPTPSAPR